MISILSYELAVAQSIFKWPITPGFSFSGCYSALGCFTGWGLKKSGVSILSQPT